jgi:hypothetical protein
MTRDYIDSSLYSTKAEKLRAVTRLARDLSQGTLVYFAQGEGIERVKIGATRDPKRRLRELQAYSPVPLQMIVTFYGGTYSESLLHQAFSEYRLWGEWFEFASEMKDFLDQMEDLG